MLNPSPLSGESVSGIFLTAIVYEIVRIGIGGNKTTTKTSAVVNETGRISAHTHGTQQGAANTQLYNNIESARKKPGRIQPIRCCFTCYTSQIAEVMEVNDGEMPVLSDFSLNVEV